MYIKLVDSLNTYEIYYYIVINIIVIIYITFIYLFI